MRHRQDLGFYALLETLVRSVPPRRLATFYLDAAETQAEDVSERLLRTSVRRTLDAINAIVELQSEGRPPVRRPGVTCRWCPLAESCDEGQAYLDDGPDADVVGQPPTAEATRRPTRCQSRVPCGSRRNTSRGLATHSAENCGTRAGSGIELEMPTVWISSTS